MPSYVHPTAIVDPSVILEDGTEIGPFCLLQGRVVVGERTKLRAGVVIGGLPMDRSYRDEETVVVIGRNNVFFEYVSVHRATGTGEATVIGDGNWIMAYVHIAHNCRVGTGCTLSNGVQLAGYVWVADGANVGGLTGVHQMCRVGRLAMIGACSFVNKDVPPFMLAAGRPCRVYGINRIGLVRADFAPDKIAMLEQVHRLVYRSEFNLGQALRKVERELIPGPADTEIREFIEFCSTSTRGIELRAGDG